MKGKELVKQLQKNGWTIDRIRGSHYVMKKGNQTAAFVSTVINLSSAA